MIALQATSRGVITRENCSAAVPFRKIASAPGGTATKLRMLALEGVSLAQADQPSFAF